MTPAKHNMLFRQTALTASCPKAFGNVTLAQPLPMRVFGLASFLIAIAFLALLTTGTYTRKVRVSGQFASSAGTIKVVTPQFGRITKRFVAEGDLVNAGQPVFELTDERFGKEWSVDARIDSLIAKRKQDRLAASQIQANELKRKSETLISRQHSIEDEIQKREQQLKLQNTQIENAKEKLARYTKLSGYISPASLGELNAALTAELARKNEFETEILTVQRNLLEVQDEISEIATKNKLLESDTGQELARLEQEEAENHSRRVIRITSPVSGTVTSIALESGQTASPGSSLATILPTSGKLQVHLLVPSRAIGFISLGQRVLLRVNAFPYQKYGQVLANVTQIEQSPMIESTSATAGVDPIYRVVLGLSRQSIRALGQEREFKVGMTVEADILQDRRRLIEWLFEPLFSISNSFQL
jgi:membrane fusion protein